MYRTTRTRTNLSVRTYSQSLVAGVDYLTPDEFAATAAGSITTADITNWNTAYGWGNHAEAGYLTQAQADLLYLKLNP